MNSDWGKYIMITGAALLVIGVIIYFFHDKLHWIGHLPGDIRIERENFRFYFPLTTLVIFSLIGTIVLAIIRKFFS